MDQFEFATLATSFSLDDLTAANVDTSSKEDTPVLSLIDRVRPQGYQKFAIPLANDKWKARWRAMCILAPGTDVSQIKNAESEREAEVWRKAPGFLRDEVTMTRLDESESIIALVSDWLQLDAHDEWVRYDSEIALQQEIAYAYYLNVTTVILPAPRNRTHVASYGRAVNACLKNAPFLQISIRLPIDDPAILRPKESASSSSARFSTSMMTYNAVSDTKHGSPLSGQSATKALSDECNLIWEMWDVIRTVCDYSPRLTLSLDLSRPLPSDQDFLSRWSAEPVQHLILPASAFIANNKGYPVLPKNAQFLVRQCMVHRPTVILSDVRLGLHNKRPEAVYCQYVRHLEKTSPAVMAAQTPGTVENFAHGYQDYLQAPLQPLFHNLQSGTYQVFERDPVKYQNYEEAIYRALMDLPQNDRIVICVAGAGRGPLVSRSLTAVERSGRQAFVYIIEKNPSAYVTLQDRQRQEWGSKVHLVFGDMRHVILSEQVDVLVTELLGSFGDNELSPECLDGAMRFLKPNGISIPSSYTAHLAPLSSSKLYNEAGVSKSPQSAEIPYVVMLQNVNILSGDSGGFAGRCGPQVQECWEFEHPRKDVVVDSNGLPLTNSHNTRSANLTFHIPHPGILHGLAGYFEAVLYHDIGLSIHPFRKDRISKDMLSWFPLFFPFKDPLYLPSNSELQISIWRLTDERRVWYEWYAQSFLPTLQHPSLVEGLEDASKARTPFLSSSSPHHDYASPLIDAVDPITRSEPQKTDDQLSTTGSGVIKIGQTSLHNPGGRSSWFAL